jgi:hypothetical protein
MPFKIPRPVYDAEVVAAIEEHLDQERLTAIESAANLGHADDGLKVLFAVGGETRTYNRPMLQVLPTEAFSCSRLPARPCPDCDDWARSWKCEEHHELPYDTEAKAWIRPEREAPVIPVGPALRGLVEGIRIAPEPAHSILDDILAAFDGATSSDIRERPAYRLLNPNAPFAHPDWVFSDNPITDAEVASIRASIREAREDTRETAVRVVAETEQGHQAFEFRAERRGG